MSSSSSPKDRKANINEDVDLDKFWAEVESKLRGPFSSLDLVKAVSTASLRGTLTAEAYMKCLSQVMARTDKITRCRVLIGFLGMEPQIQTDRIIDEMLTDCQQPKLHEEWVRCTAGLVQGILFQKDPEESSNDQPNDKDENERNQNGTSRQDGAATADIGKEAAALLEKTAADVMEAVQKQMKETNYNEDEAAGNKEDQLAIASLLKTADTDPTAAPYRYALLNKDLLQQTIPDLKEKASSGHGLSTSESTYTIAHSHFCLDETASILVQDELSEKTKAAEEEEHSANANNNSKGASGDKTLPAGNDKTNGRQLPIMPGVGRSSNTTSTAADAARKKKAAARPKTSLFMPSKRPGGGRGTTVRTGGRGGGGRGLGGSGIGSMKSKLAGRGAALAPVAKKALHVRKAGAATSLLGKKKRNRMAMSQSTSQQVGVVAGGDATGTGSGTNEPVMKMGRTSKFSNARSKMKMIDVSEVKNLAAATEEKSEKMRKKVTKKSSKLATAMKDRLEKKKQMLSQKRKLDATKTIEKASTKPMEEEGEEQEHLQGTQQMELPSPEQPPTKSVATAMAALTAYQAQVGAVGGDGSAPQSRTNDPIDATNNNNHAQKHTIQHQQQSQQSDWRVMLQEKNNRLSSEDRFRIQQFFENRYNPTPEVDSYKMKLHESRTSDPNTREPVKETFYLELNYLNFTSKQSKKTKRYKD